MRNSPAITARLMTTGTAMTATMVASSTPRVSATSVLIAGMSLRLGTSSSRLNSVTVATADTI